MPPAFSHLAEAARWYDAWLREAALPLWCEAGLDPARGSFQEALTAEGAPCDGPRRSRVQSRQIWAFATAARAGLGARYARIAARAYDFYQAHYLRPDGLFARLADVQGRVLDPTPALYEQAFSLLAMAGLQGATGESRVADARRTRAALRALRHPAGGYREAGDQPFQANAQMHLLEAALAWEDAGDESWTTLSDEIARLALDRFIDPDQGLLREFFDDDWRPLDERRGGLIEPGHQFEWAWLLDCWSRRRGRTDLRPILAKLYENGARGLDPSREVVVEALWQDLSVRDSRSRIWPQTERLKAALAFGHPEDALSAARGLLPYLQVPARGGWRDRMQPDGAFLGAPAPATSFYHLLGAILPLLRATGRLPA